jgi:hypothetical protein
MIILPGRKKGSLTHKLLVMEWAVVRLHVRKNGSVTHCLLVMGWYSCNETGAWQTKRTMSLTPCMSFQCDKTTWQKKGLHHSLALLWDEM